jgi:cytidine deaminase
VSRRFHILQEAVAAAVNAAVNSYAPYSRCPAGLALVTNSGRVYGGGVIESCAYNPTLNPMQSAYIAFAAAGEADFAQVRPLLVLPQCHRLALPGSSQGLTGVQ